MKRFSCVLACLLAMLAAGCATPTPKVELKPGALRAGQLVALVEPPPISHYFMWAAHPGMAFGAIGGLVAGAQFEAQGKEVAALVAQQGFVPHAEITDAFRRDLESAGYRVEVVRGVWKPDGNLMRLDVARIPASYDRLLVITPALFGFYSRGITGNYVPSLRLRVALYGTDREKPLYDSWHITGLEPSGAGWTVVPPVTTNFASYQLMVSQPQAMADSLRKGIVAVTRSATRELAPKGAFVPTAGSRVAPPADAAALQRVAGSWLGRLRCGEYTGPGTAENPKPWSQPVRMIVQQGDAVMTRGGPETNYDERIAGQVAPDLTLSMQGQGAMHRSPNIPWYTQATGRFDVDGPAARFNGDATLRNVHGQQIRSCTLALTRE